MSESNKSQLVNWMKLILVKNLGPRKIEKLFQTYNSIEQVYSASKDELIRTRIFNEKMIENFEKLKQSSPENFLKNIEECEKKGIKILTFMDGEYPQNLKRISDSPLILYLKGDLSLLHSKQIAIVGSRSSTEKTKEWVFEQSKMLAKEGITVTSGGAIGVDTSAHKGALENNGKTICVLGSGMNVPFPPENKELFDKIADKGLLVSEYSPNFQGSRFALLQRNRITSGLSQKIILASSNEKGGAMVQTQLAYNQKISIYVPSLSLNLLPNEGVRIAIEKFGAKEILSIKEILNKKDEFIKDQRNGEVLKKIEKVGILTKGKSVRDREDKYIGEDNEEKSSFEEGVADAL